MQDYQRIVRRLVDEGNEFDKVDFKATYPVQEKVGKARLAWLVSAIANTDREDLDNYGYVIIGAEKRKLIGGADFFSDDKQCSALARGINAYLDPLVRFDVKGFYDETVGWFGALVVLPRLSVTGPHFIGKGFSDDRFSIAPGQCFVRVGEETKLAQRSDFERMYQQKYSLEIERILDGKQEPRPELLLLWQTDGGTVSNEVQAILPLAAPVLRPLDDELAAIRRRKLRLPDANDKPLPHAAYLGVSGISAVATLPGGRSKESIERYNRELDSFCGQYARFHEDLTEFNDVLSRSVKVTFVLRNGGRVPANKAEFDLHLPDGVSARKALPDMPKKPKEPNELESALSNIVARVAYSADLEYDGVNRLMGHLPVNSPDYGPLIERSRVEHGLDELKHGREYNNFDSLYVLLPSEGSDWSIPYTIHANNLPEPLSGTLRLSIQRAQMNEAQWTEHCTELFAW